ncbi:MAG: SRPBCC family protein [Verrucomicrobiae bacterium]|nr:SRPBCC family protein [Verrucomicrobiae bacterium]
MSATLFESELWLPRPRHEVFPFFASARNLQTLTPPWLHFEVLTPEPIPMHPGALIDYRIRVHGIPLRWRTEIAEWEPPHRFVDVQRRGPYTLWHHTHAFEERDGGTQCRDVVRYRPRGGWLIDKLFVRRDVERIFAYRRKRLLALFGEEAAEAVTPRVAGQSCRKKRRCPV